MVCRLGKKGKDPVLGACSEHMAARPSSGLIGEHASDQQGLMLSMLPACGLRSTWKWLAQRTCTAHEVAQTWRMCELSCLHSMQAPGVPDVLLQGSYLANNCVAEHVQQECPSLLDMNRSSIVWWLEVLCTSCTGQQIFARERTRGRAAGTGRIPPSR